MTEQIPIIHYHINTAARGAPLGNKVSDVNIWSAANIDETIRPSPLADVRNFAETIQITCATGGNPERDLFCDPLDTAALTDYNFDKLITACRAILSLGLKPYLKTGNVPLKLSTGAAANPSFGVNCYPPDNFDDYYRYIRDTAAALAEEFGLGETRSWRYCVLTEYDNIDWFHTPDKDPERSMRAYFALYDTTVAALQEVLGEKVCVGAHAMSGAAPSPIRLWNPALLLEHCAAGENFHTGGTGSRICFLTVSSYEWPMCKGEVKDLQRSFAPYREMADKYGLKLSYGVDESRIGVTESGGSLPNSLRFHPSNHIVGHTYQAAYDAQLIKQMVDYDIDYCSAWGYTSAHGVSCKGDAPDCYPTVSFHVANEYHSMCRGGRLPVRTLRRDAVGFREDCQTKVDILASADEKYVYIMAFNFGNSLEYDTAVDIAADIDLPEPEGQKVEIIRRVVGGNANFFPEWLRDRERYGIGDDCFLRSPESAALDAPNTLKRGRARKLYFDKLRDKYVALSKLTPETLTERVRGGKLPLRITLPANNVVFYTVKIKGE